MCSTANKARSQYGPLARVLALVVIPGTGNIYPAEVPPAQNAETVSIYLNVESKGGLVTGLQRENFRLWEDGHSQVFRLEKPEEPAAIAFLIEYSTSSGYFMEDLQYVLDGFKAHGIEGHWYALATFANMLEIHTDFTKLSGEINQTYAQLGQPIYNEINTYDAVYEMLDKMARLPGRKILIVIGSGVDTFSQHSMQDIQKKIETDNVSVFAAGLGSLLRGTYDPYVTTSGQMQLIAAQSFLQMLASKSGGFAWFPRMPVAFHDVTEGMMQSIATQYRIVYTSKARGAGKFRKIKVEAFQVVNDKRENFKVLVREGWR